MTIQFKKRTVRLALCQKKEGILEWTRLLHIDCSVCKEEYLPQRSLSPTSTHCVKEDFRSHIQHSA